MFKKLVFAALPLLLTLAGWTARSEATVNFTNTSNAETAVVGVPYTLNLTTLLASQGTGTLLWGTTGTIPGWVTVSSTGTLSGTPTASDVGTTTFTINVKDAETGSIASIVMTVVAPPTWTQNPINLGTAKQGTAFTFNLNTVVSANGSGPLTFTATSLPTWLKLNPNGTLTGTPSRADVGTFTNFSFTATGAGGATATAPAEITVLITYFPPTWVSNPIALPNGTEDVAYSQNIAGDVTATESGPLTFKIVTGPSDNWITMSAAGVLSGTPARKDDGSVSLLVEVDQTVTGTTTVLSAQTTMTFTVIKVNHPPVWSQNPITLPAVTAGTAVNANIATYANDQDGNPLTFSIVSGPSWATISSAGVISGTPPSSAVGPNAIVVAVNDTNFTVQDTVDITVNPAPLPPSWNAKPTVLPDAKENAAYSVNLNKYATSPQGSPLFFTILSGPSWATINSSGAIVGTPTVANLGLNTFQIKVSDNIVGSDTAQVNITVDEVFTGPAWTTNPIPFSVNEQTLFTQSLSTYMKDADPGVVVTYTLISGPNWATLSTTGTLSGTPQIANEGANTFVVQANDGHGNTANVNVVVTVLHVDHGPSWTQNPITLPDAKERTPYSQTLTQYVTDIDPNPGLVYSIVSGPSWLAISPDGTVTGTAQRANDGVNSFQVLVTDAAGKSAQVTVNITVDRVNLPPSWTINPIPLPNATDEVAYSYSVAQFGVVDTGLTPTYSKVSGPAWVSVSPTGVISGTPAKTDVGAFSVVIQLSDGTNTVNDTANGTVVFVDKPPVINQTALNYTVKERATLTDTLTKYVTSPDNNPLTFTLVNTESWVTLTSAGALTLAPTHSAIGVYKLAFNVFDTFTTTQGFLNITVLRDPQTPVWSMNPINYQTNINQPFSQSVAQYAKDLDGVTLTFSLVSGPSWLTVSSTGTLTGTPTAANLGTNTFVVSAKNDALSAPATVIITVIDPDKPPYWIQNPITLPDGKAGTPYSQSVASFATDPNAGDTPTFTIVSGPSWAKISSNGTITGTPGNSNVGLNTFTVQVADGEGKTAVATVNITVDKNIQPITWNQDPIPLGNITATTPYTFNLAPLVTNPAGNPLTFSLVSGPSWLVVNSNGTITGTPPVTSEGAFVATFSVTDGTTTATVGAFGTVVAPSSPPVLNASALHFYVTLGQTLSVNLNQTLFVTNTSGGTLTFALTNPDNWVKLATSGALSATPPTGTTLGDHTYTLIVTNAAGQSATDPLTITVQQNCQPPVWSQNPINLTASVGSAFTNSVAALAKDPMGNNLAFSKVSGPAWLTIGTNGALTGTPQSTDSGTNTFVIQAENQCSSTNATVVVSVGTCQPPVWSQNPINLTATVGTAFTNSVATLAKDPMGNNLAFLKVSGPSWLTVGSSGALTGTPQSTDSGTNTFVIQAENQCSSTNGNVVVTVGTGSTNQKQVVKVDDVVPNAPSENLWIVENPWKLFGQDGMARSLNDNISCFYDALNAAKIDHTGMYLASDASNDYAKPIQSSSNSLFLLWNESDIASDFTCRTDSFSVKPCDNSPIWAMFGFYGAVPTTPAWTQNYMQTGVPMDAMIVSRDSDRYKEFQSGTTAANDTPTDFAQNFINFHTQLKKPYRISAIAPQCDSPGVGPKGETDDDVPSSTDPGPFQDLTTKTGGKFYPYSCNFDMCGALKDYAQQVIFRAYLYAKKSIQLTSTPNPVSSITVTVGGVKLTGNTGSASDAWSYNATTNAVTLNWMNIANASSLKAGDTIEVDYTANGTQMAALDVMAKASP